MSSAEIVGDICFTGAFADTVLSGHNASCNGYKRERQWRRVTHCLSLLFRPYDVSLTSCRRAWCSGR